MLNLKIISERKLSYKSINQSRIIYAYRYPDQFIYHLEDFKNSFQQFHIHFIMASAQKIVSRQPGHRNVEEGACLIWC